MNYIQKKARNDYTNTLFDSMWSGKRVWDALDRMVTERNILSSKTVNCCSFLAGRGEHIFEMDWKETGLKVVLNAHPRPTFGILDFLFGSAKDKCYRKAIKWLDDACDEGQVLLFSVKFMVGDTVITGGDRNKKLAEKFVKYLDSIEPAVSPIDANRKADEIINS